MFILVDCLKYPGFAKLDGDKEQESNIQVFNDWVKAFLDHNIEKMASLSRDEIIINSKRFGVWKGRDGASTYWHKLYDAFPDIHIKPVTVVADRSRVMSEIDFSGTHRGKINGIPGTGKKFSLRGAFVYDMKDGKIKEIRMYYDKRLLNNQLDIMQI